MVGIRKDKDNAVRTVVGLTRLGLVTSIGASVVTRVGGNPGGLKTVSGFLPVGGLIAGSFITLGLLRGLTPKRTRRR